MRNLPGKKPLKGIVSPCDVHAYMVVWGIPTILNSDSIQSHGYFVLGDILLLNQVSADQRPARTWFLKITFVHDVCMRACVRVCVCVSAPEAINN